MKPKQNSFETVSKLILKLFCLQSEEIGEPSVTRNVFLELHELFPFPFAELSAAAFGTANHATVDAKSTF